MRVIWSVMKGGNTEKMVSVPGGTEGGEAGQEAQRSKRVTMFTVLCMKSPDSALNNKYLHPTAAVSRQENQMNIYDINISKASEINSVNILSFRLWSLYHLSQ